MDQKRRKFLIKQKKKRKEKLRKLGSIEKSTAETGVPVAKKFKRADKFIGCEEAFKVFFIPADGVMYRIVHNPLQRNDELVQNEQEFEGFEKQTLDLPMTVAPGSTIEEQYEHVREWSLSFYLDLNELVNDYWKYYDKRKTVEAKENYQTKRGTSIAKYNLVPEVGVMQRQPDFNSHLVVAEYEGIVFDDYRDKAFGLPLITRTKDEHE